MTKLLGHGPFGWRSMWPLWPWRKLFYDPRPDLHRSKTRPPEWRKLQSQNRYFQALFCYLGPPSHILWNILYPYCAVMSVAIFVALGKYCGYSATIQHPVFMDAFRLSSFAMSLVLAFRLNRAYDRWNLARSSIAGVGNGATTIFLQAATWVTDPFLLDEFRRFCIVWPFSIMQTVQSEKVLHPVAAALLHPSEQAIYYKSRKGRQVVVTKIRALAFEAKLPMQKFIAMENAIASTWTSAGAALRIKFQAMPLGLSLVGTGFIEIWCILLPFGLWADENTLATLLPMAIISLLLLSSDEMASQMENPFDLMPMEDIMVTYERDINRIQDELGALRSAATTVRHRNAAAAAGASDGEGHVAISVLPPSTAAANGALPSPPSAPFPAAPPASASAVMDESSRHGMLADTAERSYNPWRIMLASPSSNLLTQFPISDCEVDELQPSHYSIASSAQPAFPLSQAQLHIDIDDNEVDERAPSRYMSRNAATPLRIGSRGGLWGTLSRAVSTARGAGGGGLEHLGDDEELAQRGMISGTPKHRFSMRSNRERPGSSSDQVHFSGSLDDAAAPSSSAAAQGHHLPGSFHVRLPSSSDQVQFSTSTPGSGHGRLASHSSGATTPTFRSPGAGLDEGGGDGGNEGSTGPAAMASLHYASQAGTPTQGGGGGVNMWSTRGVSLNSVRGNTFTIVEEEPGVGVADDAEALPPRRGLTKSRSHRQ